MISRKRLALAALASSLALGGCGYKEKIRQLEKENSVLKADVDQLQAEADELQTQADKLGEYKSILVALDQSNAVLRARIAGLQTKPAAGKTAKAPAKKR